MNYPLTVAGFEGRALMLQTSSFFAGPKLLLDGFPAPKGPKRGQFALLRNDGSQAIAELNRSNFLDPVPKVMIDGITLAVVQPLKWYQWVWAGIPILLLFIGGALGGLTGAIATGINSRIFRSALHPFAKYALSGLISVAAALIYLILVILFRLAIKV